MNLNLTSDGGQAQPGPPGAPSGWFLRSFNNPILLKHILLFRFHKMPSLHLYCSCPGSGINHFSEDPWLLTQAHVGDAVSEDPWLLTQAHVGDAVGWVPDTAVKPASRERQATGAKMCEATPLRHPKSHSTAFHPTPEPMT